MIIFQVSCPSTKEIIWPLEFQRMKKKKHTFWLEELKTSQVNLKIQRGGMLWPVLQSTTDLPVLPPSYRRIGLNSLGFHLKSEYSGQEKINKGLAKDDHYFQGFEELSQVRIGSYRTIMVNGTNHIMQMEKHLNNQSFPYR